MSSKEYECRLSANFTKKQKAEIVRYANQNGISCANAIRVLCNRALAKDFDKQYAPRINQITQQIVDRAVGQIETVVLYAVDEIVTEIRLSELRQVVALSELEKDEPVDEGGYNPNVFIPERRAGEKEIIWPR